MAYIKLHFVNGNHLTTLLADKNFLTDINYLTPQRIDNNSIILDDPVSQHAALETELVVLSKFARAIENIIFPETNYSVEFLNPFLRQQKGGLVHNGAVIINSTELDVLAIDITVREI